MTAIPNIEDYALIRDSRTAALISKAGSIDWLCLPQFDSPSYFNRLLDHWRGGHFTIASVTPFSVRRTYRDTTAVLQTEFQTGDGIVRVTDCMPVLPESEKSIRLFPFGSLLRCIEGLEGTVELDIVFKPRPDHGRLVPSFHRRDRTGYGVDLGNRLLYLATDLALSMRPGALEGRALVQAGSPHMLWCTYSEDAPAVYPLRFQIRTVPSTADCASESTALGESHQRSKPPGGKSEDMKEGGIQEGT
ncbi:MAG TPA: trehalase-like domain-containing protein, partial [Nitrospiraceae bacterium]|nr:trehalase-like domain-containing protein [Nitrospiraceae bacterium]